MNPILLKKYSKAIRQFTINEQFVDHFKFNESEYVIIKKFKSNFKRTWIIFCLKLNKLRKAVLKEVNCCFKKYQRIKNVENKSIN